jgi:hypothetical protein
MRTTTSSPVIAAIVILVACGAASAQEANITFGGFFETTLGMTQTHSVAVKSIALNSTLGIGQWVASADAKFTDSQFDTLTVYASGPLGNVGLTSSLVFNPSTVSFVSWKSGASFTLLDLAVTDVLYITTPQASSYNALTLSGTFNDLTFQGTFKGGICPLCFWEAGLCLSSPWVRCGADLKGCLQLTDAGFQSLTLTMTGLSLFGDAFGVDVILDTSISFSIDEKSFTPTLHIAPDWALCVELELLGEISVEKSPFRVDAALIYGLIGECTLDNGVTFTFAESLDPAKNSSVTGKAEYWEVFRISGPMPACCNDAGSFEIAAYFGEAPPGSLFDLGLIEASFDLQLLSGFAVTFEGEYPTDGTDWAISVTMRVFW